MAGDTTSTIIPKEILPIVSRGKIALDSASKVRTRLDIIRGITGVIAGQRGFEGGVRVEDFVEVSDSHFHTKIIKRSINSIVDDGHQSFTKRKILT